MNEMIVIVNGIDKTPLEASLVNVNQHEQDHKGNIAHHDNHRRRAPYACHRQQLWCTLHYMT